MQRFDVCNGDADGLCAALQWRLHEPAPATLVTGLKHEIALLERAPAREGDEVNVFDLSMQRNRAHLVALLAAGARVRYFDHHAVRDIPSHPALQAHIDVASDTCTSLLVDRVLDGAFRAWALVGAYGDNLTQVGDVLAVASGISAEDRKRLRRMGEAINYNAYGNDEGDVRIAPRHLYKILARYCNPLDMLAHEGIVDELDALRRADLRQALAWPPHWQGAQAIVVLLPDEPWSRRVIGCLANELANAQPARAHAVLNRLGDDGYIVSVRAPLVSPSGANELCSGFGGGGRARAAGIDQLPAADLDRFVAAFAATPWG
jgi:single-stranded DNA-specific DHH superfamily exonuclease